MPTPTQSQFTIERTDLSLAGARAVLDAAIAAATTAGLAVCVAVCDAGGNALATARMDGAPILSLQIATDKAWTVAVFNGLPTAGWWQLIEGEPALVHGITHTPRLVVFGGGEPVRSGGALAGAVGVSGGSAEQDAMIAATGAAALAEQP
ncbi:MAG: heme-binding protein [Acidimicrobiaceae bacterium]|nr:heme-binding protein [Acidimicrobiaceae bacterium]